MHFKFEVQHKKIKRKNIQILASEESKCFFIFDTNWVPMEKYVIFWTKKGKSYVEYLGTGRKCECDIPEEIFNYDVFSIQVWVSDDLYTQKLKLSIVPKKHKKPHHQKKSDEEDSDIMFHQVFSQLKSKIDNIVYNNGFLECYANKKLIYKISILDDIDRITDNSKVTIVEKPSANTGMFKTYQIMQGGAAVTGEIDIPESSSTPRELIKEIDDIITKLIEEGE